MMTLRYQGIYILRAPMERAIIWRNHFLSLGYNPARFSLCDGEACRKLIQ